MMETKTSNQNPNQLSKYDQDLYRNCIEYLKIIEAQQTDDYYIENFFIEKIYAPLMLMVKKKVFFKYSWKVNKAKYIVSKTIKNKEEDSEEDIEEDIEKEKYDEIEINEYIEDDYVLEILNETISKLIVGQKNEVQENQEKLSLSLSEEKIEQEETISIEKNENIEKENSETNNENKSSYLNLYYNLKKILFISDENNNLMLRQSNYFYGYIYRIINSQLSENTFSNPYSKTLYTYFSNIYEDITNKKSNLEDNKEENSNNNRIVLDLNKLENLKLQKLTSNITALREKYIKFNVNENECFHFKNLIIDGNEGLKKLVYEIIDILGIIPEQNWFYKILDSEIVMTKIKFATTDSDEEDVPTNDIIDNSIDFDEDLESKKLKSNLDELLKTVFDNDKFEVVNKKLGTKKGIWLAGFYIFIENNFTFRIKKNKLNKIGSLSALSTKILKVPDSTVDSNKEKHLKILRYFFENIGMDTMGNQNLNTEILLTIQEYMENKFDYIKELRKKIDIYSENDNNLKLNNSINNNRKGE